MGAKNELGKEQQEEGVEEEEEEVEEAEEEVEPEMETARQTALLHPPRSHLPVHVAPEYCPLWEQRRPGKRTPPFTRNNH